jgi:hypothetical protein
MLFSKFSSWRIDGIIRKLCSKICFNSNGLVKLCFIQITIIKKWLNYSHKIICNASKLLNCALMIKRKILKRNRQFSKWIANINLSYTCKFVILQSVKKTERNRWWFISHWLKSQFLKWQSMKITAIKWQLEKLHW